MLYGLRSGERSIYKHGPCNKRSRNMLACMLPGADPMSAEWGEILHTNNCFIETDV